MGKIVSELNEEIEFPQDTTNELVHCGECIYFNRFDEGKVNLGYCQIDPPIIIQSLGNKKGNFPIVEDKDWCGQGLRSSALSHRVNIDLNQNKER